jgi:hypothetical protein
MVALSIAGRDAGATKSSPPLAGMLNLPLRFEPNRGQVDDRVRFLARGPGYGLYLTTEGATLALRRAGARAAAPAVVSMHLAGGRRDVQPVAGELEPGVTNYLLGNDRARWKTGIEGYARVRYPAVLPGVDLVYHGSDQRQLEYDVELAPGADPKAIALVFEGVSALHVRPDGSAVLSLPRGEIVEHAPVAYQLARDGRREPVEVRYAARAAGLGFAVGAYDRARPLVIDPVFGFSTYLGGTTGGEIAWGVAVDSADNVIVAGQTESTNFPGPNPLFTNNAGGIDGFVAKLNPSGSSLIFSTYYGGGGTDIIYGVTVDATGDIFITGDTGSSNFPVTLSPAYAGGPTDAFVARLTSTGNGVVFSTLLGGSQDDHARAIAVDGSDNAFVAGYTGSTNFPMTQALQGVNRGGWDVFVTKLNLTGARVYSTYIGGSQNDSAYGLAVDPMGEAIVTGSTSSINTPGCSGCVNFPTAAAFQHSGAGFGTTDAFVSKLNASGSAFVYSTYLGGSASEYGAAVATDSSGNAYVAGNTSSPDFPTASPLQATLGSATAQNAFVTELNPAGSAPVFSTYLGGNNLDVAQAIALRPGSQIFVAGWTGSIAFPVVSPLQATLKGINNAFVTALKPAGNGFVYSTYLGGTNQDSAYGLAVDSGGNAVVVGSTSSTDFPKASALQPAMGGTGDAFVTKIVTTSPPVVPATSRTSVVAATALLLAAGIATLVGRRRAPPA